MSELYSDDIWRKSNIDREFSKTSKLLLKYCTDNTKFSYSLVDLVNENIVAGNKIFVTDNFLKTKHVPLYPEFYGVYYYNPEYISRLPTKLFNCFINRADYFRQSWLYQFVRRGILNKGAVSYHLDYRDQDIDNTTASNPDLLFEHLFQGNKIFQSEHDILKNQVPLMNFDYSLEQAIIDSKISLVLETYFDKTHGVAFSEKIFRNLLLPRPFLLFNNPGAVAHLRRCGFDVYDDIVDHSYDDIVDGVTKQIHMLDQICSFEKIDYTAKTVARLEEGCNHNTNRLKELGEEWPRKLQSVIDKLETNELR